MDGLSGNDQSRKEVEKDIQSSWRLDTKFRQEKFFQQDDNNLLKVGGRTQLIQWKCPPIFSLGSDWLIAAGEGSVELEVQKQREKSVAEYICVHPHSIPANPSIALDLDNHPENNVPLIPTEELEEGELPPCDTCASSKSPIPSTHANVSSQIGSDEVIAAIVAFARSRSDLIDPDLLTLFLNNPQMVVDQLMRAQPPILATDDTLQNCNQVVATPLASVPAGMCVTNAEVQSTTISTPVEVNALHALPGRTPECRVLPHAGMPIMAGHDPSLSLAQHSSNNMPAYRKEYLKMLVNKYGAHESMGDKPFPSAPISHKTNPVVPISCCKFFNSSKGCWNGSKCHFRHDVDALEAKRRKATG